MRPALLLTSLLIFGCQLGTPTVRLKFGTSDGGLAYSTASSEGADYESSSSSTNLRDKRRNSYGIELDIPLGPQRVALVNPQLPVTPLPTPGIETPVLSLLNARLADLQNKVDGMDMDPGGDPVDTKGLFGWAKEVGITGGMVIAILVIVKFSKPVGLLMMKLVSWIPARIRNGKKKVEP